MNPKISIIVPVYNVQHFLHECIDSILTQTFKDFELILVNDGSTDNSGNICDEIANLDSRVKVKHKKNGGQSSARNEGINIAKGDFIGFVDSDDWIDEDMFRQLFNNANKQNSDIVACNMYKVTKNGNKVSFTKNISNMEYNKDEAMKEIFTNNILTYSPCNKIYRRQLFDNLRFKQGSILEDMDISYKLVYRADKVTYINEPLYYYRYNENSTMRSQFSLKRVDEYEVRKDMYNFYLDKYPELSELIYFKLYDSSVYLYRLISTYYKEKIKDYSYLINLDKSILKRILIDRRLNRKSRLKVFLFLISPKLDIYTRKIIHKGK